MKAIGIPVFMHTGRRARLSYDAAVADEVSQHVPCITFGYDLCGLREGGACPECTTEISRSLHGDRLAMADPKWQRRITRGQRLIAIGLLITVLGVVGAVGLIFIFTSVVMARPGLPSAVETVFTTLIAGTLLAVPIGLCVGTVGAFLLTSQEGRESEHESSWSARNVARWSIVGTVAASIAVVMFRYLPLPGMAWLVADAVLKVLLIALMTTACVSLLKRIEALIRRVPDEPLAKQIGDSWRFTRWAMPFAGIYMFWLAAVPGQAMAGWFAVLTVPLACGGVIATLGLLVLSAMLAVLMRQCSSRFRSCHVRR